jgi:hypothetical protein
LYFYNLLPLCGGFLVSYENVVITVHCVIGVAASTELQLMLVIPKPSARRSCQSRTVSVMTIHPTYSSTILKLLSVVDQTSTVGLCCLTSDKSLSAVNERAVIVGWGDILHGARSDSNDLLRAVVQIKTDLTKCSSSIQNTKGEQTDFSYRNQLEINRNHQKSKKSPEITRNHQKSKKSPEITRNHQKSPEITRNHRKSLEITRNH